MCVCVCACAHVHVLYMTRLKPLKSTHTLKEVNMFSDRISQMSSLSSCRHMDHEKRDQRKTCRCVTTNLIKMTNRICRHTGQSYRKMYQQTKQNNTYIHFLNTARSQRDPIPNLVNTFAALCMAVFSRNTKKWQWLNYLSGLPYIRHHNNN